VPNVALFKSGETTTANLIYSFIIYMTTIPLLFLYILIDIDTCWMQHSYTTERTCRTGVFLEPSCWASSSPSLRPPQCI